MRAQTRNVHVPMIALASILLVACAMPSRSNAAEDVYAFANVDIVPMDSVRVVNDQTVIVRGSRIAEVGPASQVTIPNAAVVIDGHGKYLMPGLADMHVHLRDPTALPLFTANGVTAVQELSQNQLAELTGIPQSTLSAIENDRVNLGVERAEVLARALKCHPAVLVFPGWNVGDESAAQLCLEAD